MINLIKKYENKLIEHGLCEQEQILLGGRDAEIVWNKDSEAIPMLEKVFKNLNINSLLFAKPKEPVLSILNYIVEENLALGEISPNDAETRTFLHTIPLTGECSHEIIIQKLKERKSIIIANHGIVTYGSVTPEQAFVVFSSVCFAVFVKFFADYYYSYKQNNVNPRQKEILEKTISHYKKQMEQYKAGKNLKTGPFSNNEEVLTAIFEAGKSIVDFRMVDSFFGNISYRLGNSIIISQTGSSLDELPGCIDICPVDGSSCVGITASSEYSAHKSILMEEDHLCILHGHPKFSVIMSLLCDNEDCADRGLCYKKCPEQRFIEDIPIITGEVGTGPTGISNTLPPAIKNSRGVIVFGHGVFTKSRKDFNEAFSNLTQIERMCFEGFLGRVNY
ncbi:MAG: hypothetical protein A2W91_12695 [Bacteroidetes bacterium GWF2_38_335]|nr:MAG: hypothetical protein A2W91_12695 [Bacteroidetes bacterium GWF2_38_335]OFY77025.1 MAG: hypothetical protein A2281_00810 [Bacteroidetes bacterium RIFOXYA12_FULL_38_20]HBS86883.1 rRNA adenine dimethylase [Bacteroidales bacterium]